MRRATADSGLRPIDNEAGRDGLSVDEVNELSGIGKIRKEERLRLSYARNLVRLPGGVSISDQNQPRV